MCGTGDKSRKQQQYRSNDEVPTGYLAVQPLCGDCSCLQMTHCICKAAYWSAFVVASVYWYIIDAGFTECTRLLPVFFSETKHTTKWPPMSCCLRFAQKHRAVVKANAQLCLVAILALIGMPLKVRGKIVLGSMAAACGWQNQQNCELYISISWLLVSKGATRCSWFWISFPSHTLVTKILDRISRQSHSSQILLVKTQNARLG